VVKNDLAQVTRLREFNLPGQRLLLEDMEDPMIRRTNVALFVGQAGGD
jgi:hypothetical protein